MWNTPARDWGLRCRARVEQLARAELICIKLRFDGAQHPAVDFALPMKVQEFVATTG